MDNPTASLEGHIDFEHIKLSKCLDKERLEAYIAVCEDLLFNPSEQSRKNSRLRLSEPIIPYMYITRIHLQDDLLFANIELRAGNKKIEGIAYIGELEEDYKQFRPLKFWADIIK